MNAKFIAIFLGVLSMWIVSSQQKCNNKDFCNLEDCSKDPPYRNDENKLDRACKSNKCDFDYEFSNHTRLCEVPGFCIDGQYCSPDCITSPVHGPENYHCIAGLNCNKETGRCVKKPKCKPGEYCKRGDCEGDEKPTFPDDDACEDGSECNASFICVKVSTTTEKSEEEGSGMWFMIGFVTCMLLIFGILGLLWFFLYYRKNKKKIIKEDIPEVSTVKEVKEKKTKVSTVKEVKEKKPKVSTVKEAEVVRNSKSEVTAQISTSSIPGNPKPIISPIYTRLIEKRKSTISKKPKPKDRKFLKESGLW